MKVRYEGGPIDGQTNEVDLMCPNALCPLVEGSIAYVAHGREGWPYILRAFPEAVYERAGDGLYRFTHIAPARVPDE